MQEIQREEFNREVFDIRIKPERTIHLAPPEVDEPAVFVRVRDSSGKDLDLHLLVVDILKQRGYLITQNAKESVYTLDANIRLVREWTGLDLDESVPAEYEKYMKILRREVKRPLVPQKPVLPIDAGRKERRNYEIRQAAYLAEYEEYQRQLEIWKREREQLHDDRLNTKFYSFVVDYELRERVKNGQVVRKGTSKVGQEGSGIGDMTSKMVALGLDDSAQEQEKSTETSYSIVESGVYEEVDDWKRHRTRIYVDTVNQYTEFEDVQGELARKLARSIANAF